MSDLFSTPVQEKKPIVLRDYQDRLVDNAIYHLSVNNKTPRRAVITAPTGAGKSLIIAAVAKRSEMPTLVFQPSKELLEQNLQKSIQMGSRPSVWSASLGRKEAGNLTYATIQSLKGQGSRFKGYQLLIDEAHLYPAAEGSMIDKFLEESGIKNIVGFTATPFRLKAYSGGYSMLGMLHRQRPHLFNFMGGIVQIQELTGAGYWAPLVYEGLEFNTQGLIFNSTGADYTVESLQRNSKLNHTPARMAAKARELVANGRKAVVCYCSSIADAEEVGRLLNGDAVVVHGQLKPHERDVKITAFKRGIKQIAVNVNVLAIGFDYPGIDAIVMGRPTNSLALYYQILGRGVRNDPSGVKKDCLIADLSGNLQKFGPIEDLTIEEIPDYGWGVFGKDGVLLTGMPMDGKMGRITKDSAADYKKQKAIYDAIMNSEAEKAWKSKAFYGKR